MASRVLCRLFFQSGSFKAGNRLFFSLVGQNHVPKIYSKHFGITKNSHWTTERYFAGSSDDSDLIDIKDISRDDPRVENKLKIIMLETEMLRQSGANIPENITKDQWEELVELRSKSARRSYLLYLFKIEKQKESAKQKRKLRNEEYQTFLKTKEEMGDLEEAEYSFSSNSLFQRIYEKTINNCHNLRLLYNMPFTQPLILDCSYEQYMTVAESKNTAKQMTFIFADNRIHHDPYDLHLFHEGDKSLVMKQLRKNIPTIDDPHFPMHLHQGSYLDVFPKERLVYLTPDTRNELINYDHNAIYIIGCIVDKGNVNPLTLAKAKKEGIKMARLPIDRFLEWGTGARKTLTLNQIVNIMLDARNGATWDHALRHIPRRKLASVQLAAELKKFQKSQGEYYDRIMEIDPIKNLKKHKPIENFKMSKIQIRNYAEEKKAKSRKLSGRRLYDDDTKF